MSRKDELSVPEELRITMRSLIRQGLAEEFIGDDGIKRVRITAKGRAEGPKGLAPEDFLPEAPTQ
jgi:hypothetical protein